MKKTYIAILASAALLVSCNQEIEITPAPIVAETNAFVAKIGDVTKTNLNGFKVEWEANDTIMINGSLHYAVPFTEDPTTATFYLCEGEEPVADLCEAYFAVYPASAYVDAGYLNLPFEQVYNGTSLAEVSPMFAFSESTILSFANTSALLAFNVKGEGTVTSIVVSQEFDEERESNPFLAGMANAYIDEDEPVVELTMGPREITLTCPEGVELSPEGTVFYVSIPEGEYESLKFTVTIDENLSPFILKASGKADIKRNTLYRIAITPDFSLPEDINEAIESVQQNLTMAINTTISYEAYASELYTAYNEEQSAVASAIMQNIQTIVTWYQTSYEAGTLPRETEEIYLALEGINEQITQFYNSYIDGIEELAYEFFAGELESLQQQYTQLGNATVNNEAYADYAEYIETELLPTYAAFAQTISAKSTWAEEAYSTKTLATVVEEIVGTFEADIQIPLTQFLNVFNAAIAQLEADAIYEELAGALEGLEQQWTMVYNLTVNNESDYTLYAGKAAYDEAVETASTALSAVSQTIMGKKTWIEEAYSAGALAEQAEEIYSTFEQDIQIPLTQTLNVYNAAIAQLEADAAYEELAGALESLEQQWTMVYNSTVNNESNNTLYAGNAAYEEAVQTAAEALSAVSQSINAKKTWIEESYTAGSLAEDAEEIYSTFEQDIQIPLTQTLNVYNAAVAQIEADAIYEELAVALESLEMQWTMVYNSTVNNESNNTRFEGNAAYEEAVETAGTALSAITQSINAKKTWIEESYTAGSLVEDAEEIYSTFEEIQILLTQTLNVYNTAVAELEAE